MDIRHMNIKDYDEVYQLWLNSQGIGMRSLDDSKDGINNFLKRNPNTNFVALIDNKIVGVILCGHDGRRGYIYHTAVNELYRKHGIATLLVNKATDVLQKEGINKVALVVYKDNTIGNEFWKTQGFEKRDDLVYKNKSLNPDNI
ncbi:MAG: GNAT family N-acetyltransferase [Anaerocolumna sp.]